MAALCHCVCPQWVFEVGLDLTMETTVRRRHIHSTVVVVVVVVSWTINNPSR